MEPGESSDKQAAQPSIRSAALLGLCPRCGERTLFSGVIRFADKCTSCGLDFTRFNVGDGPAAVLTMIVRAVIVGLALWLDFSVHPPFWEIGRASCRDRVCLRL